jgi:hypothetical protein
LPPANGFAASAVWQPAQSAASTRVLPRAIKAADTGSAWAWPHTSAVHKSEAPKNVSRNVSRTRQESFAWREFIPAPAHLLVPRYSPDSASRRRSRPFAARLRRDTTRKSPPPASERCCVPRARGSVAQIWDALS